MQAGSAETVVWITATQTKINNNKNLCNSNITRNAIGSAVVAKQCFRESGWLDGK